MAANDLTFLEITTSPPPAQIEERVKFRPEHWLYGEFGSQGKSADKNEVSDSTVAEKTEKSSLSRGREADATPPSCELADKEAGSSGPALAL